MDILPILSTLKRCHRRSHGYQATLAAFSMSSCYACLAV